MVDGAFCGNCGVAIAVDDRFCGECGASQEAFAVADAGKERLVVGEEPPSPDRVEDVPGAIGVDQPRASAEPILHEDRATKKSSLGFWDAAGMAMELIVRGVYIVLCAAIAFLAFENGEPLIGGGAIAYGLYILGGGRWFVY